MEILNRYLPRSEFASYEDFKENFHIHVPESFDFSRDVVDLWAEIQPGKTALIYCSDDGSERVFTFNEISELSKRAASYFLSLGIKAGDRVLTLLRRRYEYWIAAVALHRIGAVVVPASIQLTEKDILYRVNSAQVKMILAIPDEFVIRQIWDLKEKCPTLREIALAGPSPLSGFRDFSDEFPAFPLYEGYSGLENSDEMVLYFTSGTAGYPKMVVHNRTYPLGHIVTAKYMQRVRNNGLHLTLADSGWAKFGWGNIYGQWIVGSAILAYDPIRFHSVNLMQIMEKYQPTSLCVPPTMYRFLLRDGLKREHVASIRWFSTAGEPLSGEVNAAFLALTGHSIHEGYGQTEGTPITCGFEWLEVRPSSMGKPSPLYDIRIVHSDGSRCAPGEEGEVVIFTGGKNQLGLMDHYIANGEKQVPIVDGFYHTGDIAYEDEDGYYWYVSRIDDIIKCSGYRIGPFEIESILNAHPAVRESAIIGYPDELRGQVVCAVVTLSDGHLASEALTRELQQFVRENTAPYKYPRVIKYAEALPKTTSGKIIHNQVKAMVQ